MKIANCKVNHLTNPLGYAMTGTVFSWTVEEAMGTYQTEARIIVTSGGKTVADTGWAELDSLASPVDVPLLPQTRYAWTVLVRTDAGEEAVSDENRFETGLDTWTAAWIGCDDTEPRHPVFCKNIVPTGEVRSARLYICGLGLYEARWNGEKIGEEYLTPYCNNYNDYLQVQTFDVTEQLRSSGELAVELGNGWYKGRFGFDDRTGKPFYGDSWKLIAEVHLTYADGTTQIIPTDTSWCVRRSKITFSNIYDGEHRDDRLPAVEEVPAVTVEPPKGTLTPRYSTPVKAWQELPVREIIHTPSGETVLDIGQNMAGSFRFRVHEPAGTRIRLQFGEILQDGNFYRENLRTAKAEYCYVSDGKPHVLEPKFTFYGFRYVKIEGVGEIRAEDFTALVLHSELRATGKLTTGSPLINQLLRNVGWGQLGNFLDVPTDCPQRDERMGWTGDAQVFTRTACYLHDSYAFYAKFLHDLASEQKTFGGEVPIVVPSFGHKESAAAWSDAACIIPWALYEMYGDKAILETQYDSMTAWAEFIHRTDAVDHGWLRHFHYGDWLALDGPQGADGMVGGTENAFVAGCCYVGTMELTAKAAEVLHKEEDARKFRDWAEEMRQYLREDYMTPNGRCAMNTQTGFLLAYTQNITTNPQRTVKQLTDKLTENHGMLQTGFVGTPLLCPTLTGIGREDMAFNLLLNEEYPGWLYAVKLGATTVWERWNSVLPDGSISGTGMNSLNHYSYGSIAQWIYEDVAGISPMEPGFRKAKLEPHMHRGLQHLDLSFHSAAGTWQVHWEILEDGQIHYRCTVPFGCRAELKLPYGGETKDLGPGEYSVTYRPDRNLLARYTVDTPLQVLMNDPKARTMLLQASPMIDQLPPSMYHMSMRQVGSMFGSLPDAMLEKFNALLATL